MTFSEGYVNETIEIARSLDVDSIERLVALLAQTKHAGGRLFLLGVGGSAANASHAVNDFRKIVGIEAYAPTDNVAELTARINDNGWNSCFADWLKASRVSQTDLVFVLSVGGGDVERNISPNLVAALQFARTRNVKICGIVGRDGGYTAKVADVCIIVPTINPKMVTPHTEAFQAVVWHLLVSHPALQETTTKWESAR
jgi:D-sedoheptulose 7-phosphate isomerase